MDRHQSATNNDDIAVLLLGLLNGDPRVAQSIRQALQAMPNSDRDIIRITSLLHQREFFATQPHLIQAILNSSSIATTAGGRGRGDATISEGILPSSQGSATNSTGTGLYHAAQPIARAALSKQHQDLRASGTSSTSTSTTLRDLILLSISQAQPSADSGSTSSTVPVLQRPLSPPPRTAEAGQHSAEVLEEEQARVMSGGDGVRTTASHQEHDRAGSSSQQQQEEPSSLTSARRWSEDDDGHAGGSLGEQQSQATGEGGRGTRRDLFPFILHDLLRDLEKADQTLIASWNERGDAFQIHREDIFAERLIRLYFQLDTMQEFRSTLRTWGFQVITEDDHGRGTTYMHPDFIKHSPGLQTLVRMQQTPPLLTTSLTAAARGGGTGAFVLREDGLRKRRGRDMIMAIDRNQLLVDEERRAVESSGVLREEDEFLNASSYSDRPPTQNARLLDEGADEAIGIIFDNDQQRTTRKRRAKDSSEGRREIVQEVGKKDLGHRDKRRAENDAPMKKKNLTEAGVTMAPSSSPAFLKRTRDIRALTDWDFKGFRINKARDLYDVSGLMFPWQLHQLLDDDMQDDGGNAIAWNSDGASFSVFNQDVLVSRLLPKYFGKSIPWGEFTAELSHWGFVCFTSGPQKGAFIHRLFLRGKPALCKQMRYKGKTVAELINKNQAAFLLRLHYTLSQMKHGEASAFWETDGKSFQVPDAAVFLSEVFSIYYDSLTYPVFEQKLRAWGFVKRPTNVNLGASVKNVTYSHPFFVRDEKPIVHRIHSEMQGQSINPEHSFLIRLRILLDDAERHGHATIISWLPHGKSFMIHDRAFFTDKILPHYFKTKLTSFRQTLRGYGFAQMGGRGWDSGSYYHSKFQKDDPSLCLGLSQDEMKRAMPEWISHEHEPNFYDEIIEEVVEAPASVSTTTPTLPEETAILCRSFVDDHAAVTPASNTTIAAATGAMAAKRDGDNEDNRKPPAASSCS